MKKWNIIAIATLILGIASVAWAFLPGKTSVLEYEHRIEGKLNAKITRFEAPNGDWRSETRYVEEDGTLSDPRITLGIGGKGVFNLAKDRLIYVSGKQANAKAWKDLGAYRNSEAFQGEEKVAGILAYKIVNKQGSFWLAPEFGGREVKRVVGDEVLELVNVSYTRKGIGKLPPNLPVDCSQFRNGLALADEEHKAKVDPGPCK